MERGEVRLSRDEDAAEPGEGAQAQGDTEGVAGVPQRVNPILAVAGDGPKGKEVSL